MVGFIHSYDAVMDQLECPVCLELIYPPIFQCSNGHTLCSKCKPAVNNRCPNCRVEMGNIRNLTLEKLLPSIRSPCAYRNMGCSAMVQYLTKQKHEQVCKFRPYKCPFPSYPCTVTGDIPTLVTHLQDVHGLASENTCLINTRHHCVAPYNGRDASSNPTVFRYSNHHFCLHFDAFYSARCLVYMTYLTFMGEAIDATSYRYSLEIENSTRKMTWQGIPRSIRETKEQIWESGDGLIIHQSVAKLFFETDDVEERTLRVKGKIWIAGTYRLSHSTIADCQDKAMVAFNSTLGSSTWRLRDLLIVGTIGLAVFFIIGSARVEIA